MPDNNIEVRTRPVRPQVAPPNQIEQFGFDADIISVTYCPQNSLGARGSLKSYQVGFYDLREI